MTRASGTEKVKQGFASVLEKIKTAVMAFLKKVRLAVIVVAVLAIAGVSAWYWREIVFTYGYFFKSRNYYMRVDEVREDVIYTFYYNGRVELEARTADYFETTMVRLPLKEVIAQRLLIENVDDDYYTRYRFEDTPELVVVWNIRDEDKTLYDESGRNTSEAARALVAAWKDLEKPAILQGTARAAKSESAPVTASGAATLNGQDQSTTAPTTTSTNAISALPTADGQSATQTNKATSNATTSTTSTSASETQSVAAVTGNDTSGSSATTNSNNSKKIDEKASLERLEIKNGDKTQAAWQGYYYYLAKTTNGNTLARISVDTMQTTSQAERILDGVDSQTRLATTGETLYIWTRKGQDFVLYRVSSSGASPSQVMQDTLGSLNGVRAEASRVAGRAAEIIYLFEENNQSENGVIYYYMPTPNVLAEISNYTTNAYGDNMLLGVTSKDAFLLAKVGGGSNGKISEIFSLEYDHENGQLVRNSLVSGDSMPKLGNFYTCKAYSAPVYDAVSNTLTIDSLGRVYRYNLNNNTLTVSEDGKTQSQECS